MRALAVLLALVCVAASAQTPRLPQFSDYPAGRLYRGRVAPLVESSSETAHMFRTMTRAAMAEGVNFAGHYVVAMWGCGTECMSGHIVDARTGRAVADLPVSTPFVTFNADSRLIAVMAPAEIVKQYPDEGEPIPGYYQSSYWVLEGDSLRHLGSLLASDIELIRRGGSPHALRQATPGDVLVPLAVGNSWTYARADGATVTYRITGPDPEEYSTGFLVARGRSGEQRTVEVWTPGYGVGDGSFSARIGDGYAGFSYSFGVPEAEGETGSVERATVRVGAASHEAICYVTDAATTDDGAAVEASRTCFVPRLGMVSDDRDGAMTLTSYTLR